MPRVKLTEQQRYEFHYTLLLQPRDINYGGHLGNDSLIALAGAARAHMLFSMGLSEGDLGDGKTGVIMSDLVVNYKSEAFMFDAITVETHVGELMKSGFRLFQRVRKGDKVIALVETGFATFNYEARKVAHVPNTFLNALAGKTNT